MGDYRICRLSDGKYYTPQANQPCTEGQEEMGQGAPPPPPPTAPAAPASPAPSVVGGPEAKPRVVPKTPEDPIAKAAREAREQFDRNVPTPPAAGTPASSAPTSPAPAVARGPETRPVITPAQKRPAKKGEIAELFTAAIHLVNKGIKVKVKEGLDIDEKYKTNSWKKNMPVRRAVASLDNKVELTTTLNALYAALYSNQNSKYNLTAVLDILKEKGLTLAQIAKLKGLTGDALIEALLKELLFNPVAYEKEIEGLDAQLEKAGKLFREGKYQQALEIFQSVLDLAINRKLNTSQIYYNIGRCHLQLGELSEAKEAFEAAKSGAKKADIPDIKEGLDKIATKEREIASERKKIAEGYLDQLRKGVSELSEDKRASLAQYLSLNLPKQKLITFTANGKTYAALVEEANGQWRLLSPTKRKYYLKVENNNPVVYQKTPWHKLRDLRLETTQVTPQPEERNEREAAYAMLYRITRGTLTRANFDKIWVKDKPLYLLVANNMNADKTTERGITLDKLRAFEKVIKYWANELEMSEKAIVELFASSPSFCMVDPNEVKETGQALRTKLKDVTNNNISEQLGGYPPKLVEEVKNHFSKGTANAKSVAAYLLRFTLASMTGLYRPFGVKQDVMPAYRSTSLNKYRVAAWFAGRAVTEARPPRYGAGGQGTGEEEYDLRYFLKDKEFAKIYSYQVAKIGGPEAQRKQAVSYMQKLKSEGNLRKLESFWEMVTKNEPYDPRSKYIPGMETDISNPPYSGAINIMYEAYTATRDPIMYDRAFALLKNLPNGPEKHKLLVELSLKYLGLKTSEADRRRAIEVLREINDPQYFKEKENAYLRQFSLYGIKVASAQYTLESLISAVEESLDMPHAIFVKKQSVLEGKYEPSNVKPAIDELNKIIKAHSVDNSVKSVKMRAYAYLVKAEILRAQADQEWTKVSTDRKAPRKEAIQLYIDMAFAAREAVYHFNALSAASKDKIKAQGIYEAKYKQANGAIGQVIKEKAKSWQHKGTLGVPGGPDPLHKDYYRKQFTEIIKYMRSGSSLEIQEGENSLPYESSKFKKDHLNLNHDEEHKNKPEVAVNGTFKETKKPETRGKAPVKKIVPPSPGAVPKVGTTVERAAAEAAAKPPAGAQTAPKAPGVVTTVIRAAAKAAAEPAPKPESEKK